MRYHVILSDAQVKALHAAVLNAPLHTIRAAIPVRSSEADLEVEALLDMLADLPASEEDAPGSWHDFTA